MSYAARRSNVGCSWARRCLVALAEVLATNWWPDECDVFGGDVKRGAVSLPSGRIGCRWFGLYQDLGALGDEPGDETQVYRIVRERQAQVWEYAFGEIEMRI